MNPASGIYEGLVAHARSAPKAHAFAYRLAWLYLDLAEIPGLLRATRFWRLELPALGSFRRQDYLPGPQPLDVAVRDLVMERTGHRPAGAVRMLGQARCFGHCFNPVVFFYCFAPDGALDAVVAEITNTPWRERFTYVCDCRGRAADALHFSFPKLFHVSPFMPMGQTYRWRFRVPGRDLSVHMENREGETSLFSADLNLTRRALTPAILDAFLLRQPFTGLRLLGAIYLQAARLWVKGVPFHDHPAQRPVPAV